MYRGQTYRVPQGGQGSGWNANPNLDQVPPNAMVDVENINLHRGGRQPRGGCEKVITTAITSTPEVLNIFHFIREDGSIEGGYVVDESADNIGDENGNMIVFEGSNIMCGTNDGKLYQNYTTELEDGFTADTRPFFETYYDTLYISNGVDSPMQWTDNEDYAWTMGTPKQCTAALAGAGAGNVEDGDHYYKVTFVSASGESSGGEASAVLTVADKASDGQVSLTAIQVGPLGTTARKVYRTEAGGSTYKLLTTISDNTTTIYTDNTADAGLGATVPTTNLAFIPTDWDTDPPKYFLKHGRGVNKRLWAIGSQSYPNYIYISANGVADFGDQNVTLMRIMTDRLTGMIEFGEHVFVFSRDRTFIINDAPIALINWGYQAAPFEGGAAHQRLIVKTPTDVAVMSEDGNIFSIKATQQYGDYEYGSLSKPHHVDKWMEENIDLLQIDKFHGTYDPELRMIKWFMVENGYDYPNVCLGYFIDYAMWTRHNYLNVSSGRIYHLCSTLVKETTAVWKIYTGDEGGLVYSLESATLRDADEYYTSYFKTPPIPLDNPRVSKMFDKLWIVLQPKGTEELYQEIWIDDDSVGVTGLETAAASDSMENVSTYVGATGLRLQAKIYSENDEDFFISEIMLDFEPLGAADEYAYAGAVSLIPQGYIFGGTTGAYSKNCETYNLTNDAWTTLADMPEPARSDFAASTILNRGLVYAGYNGSALSDCDAYSVVGNSWEGKTDLPSPARYSHAASSILEKGYVYAGTTGSRTQDCDRYSIASNTWANMTDLGVPARDVLAASTISDKGYVYGGNDSSELQDCDEYDPTGDSWAAKTNLPSPARDQLSGSTISSKGYIYGGFNTSQLQDCDEYEPVGNSWVSKTDMPTPGREHSGASTISTTGCVYGGYDGTNLLQDCDTFSSNTWTSKTSFTSLAKEKLTASTIG